MTENEAIGNCSVIITLWVPALLVQSDQKCKFIFTYNIIDQYKVLACLRKQEKFFRVDEAGTLKIK